MDIGRVTATAPLLTVKIDGSATSAPARNEVTGYAPTVGDAVFVEFIRGKLYIFFKAV
jgi:hypothetical protein